MTRNPVFILLNKDRYFECSVSADEQSLKLLRLLSGPKIERCYNNMFVSGKTELPRFEQALKCLGFEYSIKVDWI